MRWTTVAKVGDVPLNGAIEVRVGYEPIALFNLDGEYFATSDICSHEEFSLHGGWIESGTVECPLHGSLFDIRTGEALTPPAEYPIPTFPCRVVEGEIQVGTYE